jgi:hypothetical protein
LLFENDQFEIALKNLEDCQKMCKDETKTYNGPLIAVKRLFNFGTLVTDGTSISDVS